MKYKNRMFAAITPCLAFGSAAERTSVLRKYNKITKFEIKILYILTASSLLDIFVCMVNSGV